MNRLEAEVIAEKIIESGKNVLILDTCCLLDIVRCIQRDNLTVLDIVTEIINKYDKGSNDYDIILPSIIEKEWNSNINSVEIDTKKFIKSTTKGYKSIMKCFRILHTSEIEYTNFSHYNLEETLKECSRKLIDMSFSINSIEECKLRAFNRVSGNIPPAQQGKDSLMDCTIFEETLYIGNILRSKGYSNRIVFASSNTKEYFDHNGVISEIGSDLDMFDIEIVRAFNQGHALLSN